MVVIVGRVGLYGVEDVLIYSGRHLGEVVLISGVRALLLVGETIVSHILQRTCAARRSKGVGDGGLSRNLSPIGILEVRGAIDRHTALIEFLTILEHILAHFAQIDVEVAAILVGISLLT